MRSVRCHAVRCGAVPRAVCRVGRAPWVPWLLRCGSATGSNRDCNGVRPMGLPQQGSREASPTCLRLAQVWVWDPHYGDGTSYDGGESDAKVDPRYSRFAKNSLNSHVAIFRLAHVGVRGVGLAANGCVGAFRRRRHDSAATGVGWALMFSAPTPGRP